MVARGRITSITGGAPTIGTGDEEICVVLELGDGTYMEGGEDSGTGGAVAAGAIGLVNNSTKRRMKELREIEDEGIWMILFAYVNMVLACKCSLLAADMREIRVSNCVS